MWGKNVTWGVKKREQKPVVVVSQFSLTLKKDLLKREVHVDHGHMDKSEPAGEEVAKPIRSLYDGLAFFLGEEVLAYYRMSSIGQDI